RALRPDDPDSAGGARGIVVWRGGRERDRDCRQVLPGETADDLKRHRSRVICIVQQAPVKHTFILDSLTVTRSSRRRPEARSSALPPRKENRSMNRRGFIKGT